MAVVEAEIAKFFSTYPSSPHHDELHILLGDIRWKEKKYEEAYQLYTSVQDTSLRKLVLPKRLDCLFRLKQYEAIVLKAQEFLKEDVPINPENALSSLYYAEALFHAQEYSQAAEWYGKLIETLYGANARLGLSEIKIKIGGYLEGAEMLLVIANEFPKEREGALKRASQVVLAKMLLLFESGNYVEFISEGEVLKSILPQDHVGLIESYLQLALSLFEARGSIAALPKEKRSIENEEAMAILRILKELQIRRQFQSEPLHLEAAFEYAAFRSSLEPPEKQQQLLLHLLVRMKEEFTTQEGLMAKEYHAARTGSEKQGLYNASLMLLDAHVFRLEAKHSENLEDSKIKEEAAVALYKNLIQRKLSVTPYIVDQAEAGLKGG